MPWWWGRRKKWWTNRRWRYRRRFQRYKRRKPRRRLTRRRARRTTRRRYRRKVRRKQKKIVLKQWQPESITKCKIIGFSTLVLGAQGRQFLCWTDESEEYIQPKAPGGGGFGYERITLEWLYLQNRTHSNIWTRTNNYKDLCRYTGGTIYFKRHPETDFIVTYSIQPPFDINKFSYMELQPQNMLLNPHHKIILSKRSKPSGKQFVKVKFKPPKLMSTKWFFQKQFADFPLILLKASAANLNYPNISPIVQSQMITLYYLDTSFWAHPNWAATIGTYWTPRTKEQTVKYTFHTKQTGGKQDITTTLPDEHWPHSIDGYYKSINKNTGWFQKKVLNAYKITVNQTAIGNRPIYTGRYNPNEDTGRGNEVYAISILSNDWNAPTIQDDYVIRGVPLPMAFYGFYSFLKLITRDKSFDQHYMFVVKCDAIHPIGAPTTQRIFPFIDRTFIDSTLPYEEYLSEQIEKFWYPQAKYQQLTINSIVEAGPFVPRYTNIVNSTWELLYKYKFFFKWGGPQVTEPPIDDPKGQHTYPTPSDLQKGIQVADPKKQTPETMFHEWDYRRGLITQTALKRMSENLETDSSIYSDDSGTPKKKRKISKKVTPIKQKEQKIKNCLLSLCEEPQLQKEEEEDVHQLIKQQQHQQHQLRRNIYKLLTHLKTQQRFLSLQTGNLE
nr:MAG: ORF1 [Torque teno midi virus]